MDNIYQFKAKLIDGEEISLSKYEGQVILIVNTASKCGFTPQLKELEELYEKYKAKGFVVLGFPCNQFAKQDPGTNEEIQSFCQLNYSVSFPLFEKIEVNGRNAHPLYKYLKSVQKGLISSEIKWNFTKFLVNRAGEVIARYSSQKKPSALEKDIEAIL